ncbi:MAG: HDIG domain-containing protein [Acidimicrobiales bacterium]|nr:HDIG domain-containing protein [Acidimicrobiales bacterium]
MINRPTAIRLAIFLAVVVAIWSVLIYRIGPDTPQLEVGQLAPMTFVAEQSATVPDTVATEAAEKAARESVEPIKERNAETEGAVRDRISEIFAMADEIVIAPTPPASAYSMPEMPVPAEGEEIPAGPFTITGRVYLDADGNGVFDPEAQSDWIDQGASSFAVTVRTADESVVARTAADGTFTAQVTSPYGLVSVERNDPALPRGWAVVPETFAHAFSCTEQTCAVDDIAVAPNLAPTEEARDALLAQFSVVLDQTADYLVSTASNDVLRSALGQPPRLPTVLQQAIGRAYQEFSTGIELDGLQAAQTSVRNSPPPVIHGTQQDQAGSEAAADIVASFLLPNILTDQAATEQAKEAAAAAVDDITVSFVAGEPIVTEGTRLTQLHIDAIAATASSLTLERATAGILGVVAVTVAAIGMYLARFRKEIWSRPRMVALLGIVLLLAAIAVRATVGFAEGPRMYVLPAVAFGFITAVLFDQRIGILMALGVGVLTALGTNDAGLSVYAALAAVVPIPFVSAVSSRGAFRNAVVMSSGAAAVVALATASAFHVGTNDTWYEVVGEAAAWAFGASVIAALVGLAALQFFESAFDVTTTLRLLDLTDRNHQALQLLQEEAFGTFNHSLMVGTLADAAARSIGANPLLARAMAYYHDLGKVENPTYFIENQFGMQNPHDFLEPKESAEIIRSHVTAGVALARRFKIPSEVTQGIVCHHGDGVMRYFYEKARSEDGDHVNIDDFRHVGHKPRTAETAILMLADSLEAACRAVFQNEEPTPEAIEKVVNRIVEEKVEDGQLSESPLTLGELTQIRRAFLDSLVGHYHQRIAYPNFPGS